jgi:hypothetical protein
MGIQINGQTDTISSTDGSLNLGGTVTVQVTGDATGLTGTPNITVGVVTASSAVISGDLTVNGTTTTLDTTLTEVDKLEVGANNTTVGVAITQSGSGDILRLYDSSTQVVTVEDGGSVGIGTDNPNNTSKLHIYDGSAGCDLTITSGNVNAVDINLGDIDDHDIGRIRYNNSNDSMTFNTNGDERLRIDSTGNVGIDQSSPRSKLDVFETVTGNQTAIRIGNTNTPTSANDKRLEFVDGTGTSEGTNKYTYGYVQGYREGGSNSGALIFGTKPDNASAPSERLRITSSGNVGIGLTNPSAKLDINGSDNTFIRLHNTSTGRQGIQWWNTYGGVTRKRCDITWNEGNANWEFRHYRSDNQSTRPYANIDFYGGVVSPTSATEFTGNLLMRIHQDGNIGIGTNNPEQKLDITDGGMCLKNQSSTEGVVFRQPRPELANVQQSNGRGMMDASVSVPASTTVSIARSHWGGIALVGFSGGAQGYRLVSFGYNNTPTVLYSADWQGSLSTTFSTSTYDLRVSHNSGTAKTFWVILIGV